MWIFNLFAYFMFLIHPDWPPLPCYVWNEKMGQELGVHQDPNEPPVCFYRLPAEKRSAERRGK